MPRKRTPETDTEEYRRIERQLRQYGQMRGWPTDPADWNPDQLREGRHAVRHGLDLPSTEGLG